VKLHANAKTTPKTRLLLVQRILDGWDAASSAEAVGVSRRCALKWLARYRAEGLKGLQDRCIGDSEATRQAGQGGLKNAMTS